MNQSDASFIATQIGRYWRDELSPPMDTDRFLSTSSLSGRFQDQEDIAVGDLVRSHVAPRLARLFPIATDTVKFLSSMAR